VQAADEVGGDDVEGGFEGAEFVVGGDDLGEDLAAEGCRGRLGGRAFEEDFAAGDDGHAGAELADVVDDVGGEDDGDVGADGAEEVEEAVALGGVEAGGGLVDDDELGVGEQGLGDAEALLHAAGVGAEGLLARGPEVGLVEQGVDHLVALGLVGDALHDGEVVEHVERGHLGIDTELLGEIAEDFADRVLVLEDVDAVERDGAGVGVLQGGDGAHEGGLAGAVGAEEAEHLVADGEGEVLECFDAVGIGLG
jgi:hypothetical protein